MENTSPEQKQTIPQKIVTAPAEAGKFVVTGVEHVGRETAKVVVEGATVVANATKTVARDVVVTGQRVAQDIRPNVRAEPTAPSASTTAAKRTETVDSIPRPAVTVAPSIPEATAEPGRTPVPEPAGVPAVLEPAVPIALPIDVVEPTTPGESDPTVRVAAVPGA